MKEIWKDIPGYENKYQVSNLGNVYDKLGEKDTTLQGGYTNCRKIVDKIL